LVASRRYTRECPLSDSQSQELDRNVPAPPPTRKGPSTRSIAIAVVVAAVLWLLVAFLVLFVAPRCVKLFAEYRELIPVKADWIVGEAWWIAPACLTFSLLCCIPRSTRRIGLVLLIVVPFVLVVLLGVGLYGPYAKVVDAIGSKSPDL
jgi:hypothetical protein